MKLSSRDVLPGEAPEAEKRAATARQRLGHAGGALAGAIGGGEAAHDPGRTASGVTAGEGVDGR